MIVNFGGFLAYCILLTAFWGQVYWLTHNHFHDNKDIKAALKKEISKNMQLQLAYDVLAEKKVNVVEPAEAERGLASVFDPHEIYQQGKMAFDKEDYVTSLKLFDRIVESGVDTPDSVKAYFLKAESEYRMGEIENSVLTIRKMIRLYPDKEQTGFAMLKLAKIYQSQKMIEEAIDTYKIILRTFAQKDLTQEARRKLGSLEP